MLPTSRNPDVIIEEGNADGTLNRNKRDFTVEAQVMMLPVLVNSAISYYPRNFTSLWQCYSRYSLVFYRGCHRGGYLRRWDCYPNGCGEIVPFEQRF